MEHFTVITEFTSEEHILNDDDDAIYNFYYIIDGKIVLNDLFNGIVRDLKMMYQCNEVRRCDIFARDII